MGVTGGAEGEQGGTVSWVLSFGFMGWEELCRWMVVGLHSNINILNTTEGTLKNG